MSSEDATENNPTDSSELEAQALRFLTSIRATSSSSDSTNSVQAQKDFLTEKGLTESQIDSVFAKADSRPSSSSSSIPADSDPQAAFDLAAQQFNDPLNPIPQIPDATYPKNPLALYYQQQQEQGGVGGDKAGETRMGNRTRYEVLLSFFRSMSFFMMLGGGFTAIMVGLWRHFILPRLTSSFTLRSNQLAHHNKLFSSFLDSLVAFRSKSLAPQSEGLILSRQPAEGETVAPTTDTKTLENGITIPKRGVLKKTVSFKDEVEERRIGGDEEAAKMEKKSEEPSNIKPKSNLVAEKKEVVVEGTDVVVTKETIDGKEEEKEEDKLKPIDLQEPLRTSLNNLVLALRSDRSSISFGSDVASIATSIRKKATVSSGSDSDSSTSSDSEEDEDDDPLIFDPYKASSKSKKKHSQTSIITNKSKSGSGFETLNSSLNSLSNEIQAQHYNAMSGAGTGFGRTLGYNVPTPPSTAKEGENKGVEVAQIKAEIRNLKGLLLSRRNFPTYGRPSTPTTTSV